MQHFLSFFDITFQTFYEELNDFVLKEKYALESNILTDLHPGRTLSLAAGTTCIVDHRVIK